MVIRKIFIGLISLFIANSVLISTGFAQETNQNKEQTVSKNADSAEISPEEILKVEETVEKELKELEKNQKNDSKTQTIPQDQNSNKASTVPDVNDKTEEEPVATITAEGDFVVPTYMMPSPEDKSADKGTEKPNNQETVAVNKNQPQQTLKTSTVKITQTEFTPVAEQMAVERFLTGKTTKTMKAYKEALARQEAAKAKEAEQNGEVSPAETSAQMPKDQNAAETTSENGAENDETLNVQADTTSEKKAAPKKRLLLPLRANPAKKPTKEDLSGTEPLFKVVSSGMADKVLKDAQDQTQSFLLMPQDIKVTFYPDSAEFSGQTVKWIKAFALQALNDPRKVIEIRLSQSNPVMQQKRLYVVQRLLMNSGLSVHQIVVDYVNRPADSLILRTVDKQENVQKRKIEMKNGKIKENETINW